MVVGCWRVAKTVCIDAIGRHGHIVVHGLFQLVEGPCAEPACNVPVVDKDLRARELVHIVDSDAIEKVEHGGCARGWVPVRVPGVIGCTAVAHKPDHHQDREVGREILSDVAIYEWQDGVVDSLVDDDGVWLGLVVYAFLVREQNLFRDHPDIAKLDG